MNSLKTFFKQKVQFTATKKLYFVVLDTKQETSDRPVTSHYFMTGNVFNSMPTTLRQSLQTYCVSIAKTPHFSKITFSRRCKIDLHLDSNGD